MALMAECLLYGDSFTVSFVIRRLSASVAFLLASQTAATGFLKSYLCSMAICVFACLCGCVCVRTTKAILITAHMTDQIMILLSSFFIQHCY